MKVSTPMTKSVHKSVLLHETIEGLNLSEGKTVIDATLGGGGHTREILRRFKGTKVLAMDLDQAAIRRAEKEFAGQDIVYVNRNFREMPEFSADAIVFDLGLSSDQLESSGRGFSFIRNEPLLMTMKENPSPEELTAAEVVNTWEEKNLADIIYGYGEEKNARRIARAICEARQHGEIKTTEDLVNIIMRAVPRASERTRIHPATRTFQALRIAVGDELGALREGLAKAYKNLKPGGRLAVITFHSLEDRIVKKFFQELNKNKTAKLINKKPITPGLAEIKENRRARSAKLRIIQKES